MLRSIAIVLALSGIVLSQSVIAQDVQSETGKRSYSLGYQLGSNLTNREFELDIDAVVAGLRAAATESEPAMSEDEILATLRTMQEEARQRAEQQLALLAEENQQKANEYLAENASRSGVEVLNSGLQYREIVEGEGSRPGLQDRVRLHMRVSKIDGVELFSTYQQGEPITVDMNDTMPGMQEAVPMMRSGAEWRLFVPPELAYGERGDGRRIGPNEALVFDVKLVEVL